MKILLYSLTLFFTIQSNIYSETKIIVNGKEVKFIILNNKNEIQTAIKIHASFKKLIKNISVCMNSGNTNNKCNCTYKKQNIELNNMVTSSLIKYPHWLNTRAIKFNSNGTDETLYMKGLQKQASQKIQC